MATLALDLRSKAKGAIPNDPSPGSGLFIDEGELFLGPWEWHDDKFGGGWGAPFSVATGYTRMGSDPGARMTVEARRELARHCGVLESELPDSSLSEILAHFILGSLADATGNTRVKPLRMHPSGLRIYMGRLGQVWREPFSNDTAHPNFRAMLDVRHVDYRRLRAMYPLEALQRENDFDQQRYKTSLDNLIPAEFRSDDSIPHQTTFTEDWPTNQDSIATGQDEPWTEDSGTNLEVSSNALQNAAAAAAPGVAVCDTTLSTDDHSHEATAGLALNADGVSVFVRHSTGGSSGNPQDAYGTWAYRETGFMRRRLVEWNSATRTDLEIDDGDPGASFAIKAQADGSAITGNVGATTFSQTDTTITGTLTVGCWCQGENTAGDATLDAHTATDVAVAGPPAGSLALLGVGI